MKQYALAIWLVYGFLAFPQSPTIKIRIDDPPGISAGILWKAEKEAGALLESGGIKVIWRDWTCILTRRSYAGIYPERRPRQQRSILAGPFRRN
jgi:hypothetical protein